MDQRPFMWTTEQVSQLLTALEGLYAEAETKARARIVLADLRRSVEESSTPASEE